MNPYVLQFLSHAALARIMYCIHVLFGLFISRTLIQGVIGYKYRISIDEVSTKYHNYFIYFLIPIFRYSTDTMVTKRLLVPQVLHE
jgi:hypothetical protein